MKELADLSMQYILAILRDWHEETHAATLESLEEFREKWVMTIDPAFENLDQELRGVLMSHLIGVFQTMLELHGLIESYRSTVAEEGSE